MIKVIKNNKGYMLVEIIIASVIALVMAYFLIDITVKLVNKNNDYYVDSVLLADKSIITKEIMDDVNSKKLVEVNMTSTTKATLTYDDGTSKILTVSGTTITYGDYKKKLSSKLKVSGITIENDNDILTISISAYTNYSDEDYGIKIVVPYSEDIEIIYPKVENCKDILTNLRLGWAFGTDIPDFSESKEDGIYEAEDDLGTSCYFRGNVDYNYVKFGKNSDGEDMFWRIIRVNGDGTIRMIYDGTSAYENSNGDYGEERQIDTINYSDASSKYNVSVGYMYGNSSATTYDLTHANTNSSTIKSTLDSWYKTNIVNTGYSSYVADAIYCNDRSVVDGTGIGNTSTDYGASKRIESNSPSLLCSQQNDKFTTSTSLGNGKLTYPVGLITADEVMFAGGVDDEDDMQYYYLYTGVRYWTMSPYGLYSRGSVYEVEDDGTIYTRNVAYEYGVRPVISLKAGAIQSGSGTTVDPFKVTTSPKSEETLTNLGLKVTEGVPDFNKTSCSSGCREETVGLYGAEDDLGISYYFRGDVENNYVKFGVDSDGDDIYWRIVRINGDGTIRMIYAGNMAYANGSTTSLNIASSVLYNEKISWNTAVGYMYGTLESSTYSGTHTNTNDSTIKKKVDNWYIENIVNTGYGTYVADAIYCNDRSIVSGTGADNEKTSYGASARFYNYKNDNGDTVYKHYPTLKCSQVNDRFTKSTTVSGVKGNGALTYPVALLTADEVNMAGTRVGSLNEKYYLYDDHGFWTMTPETFTNHKTISSGNSYYQVTSPFMFHEDGGDLRDIISEDVHGDETYDAVRPVISLKANAIKSGTGTMSDPFKITS